MSRLILHAPGIHVGGGVVLLKELFSEKLLGDVYVNLDERAATVIRVPKGIELHSIPHSIMGRLKSEIYLKRISKKDDSVLCFHGLPPLLPVQGNIVVFAQNMKSGNSGLCIWTKFLENVPEIWVVCFTICR